MSLILKAVTTLPLRVDIAIPPERPEIEGFLTCKQIVRSRPEMERVQQMLADGDFENDADLLQNAPAPVDANGVAIGPKGLYSEINGLTDSTGRELKSYDEAINEVVNGPFSVYLVAALVRKYFGSMAEAPGKISRRSRGR